MISFLFLYQWFDFDELYQFLFLPIFRISTFYSSHSLTIISFSAIYPFITTKGKMRQKKGTEFPLWLYNISSLLSDNGKLTILFSNLKIVPLILLFYFFYVLPAVFPGSSRFVPFLLPLLQKVLFKLNHYLKETLFTRTF